MSEETLKELILDKQKARLEQEYSEHVKKEALKKDIDNEQVEKKIKMNLERARGLQEELDKIIDWIPTEKFDEDEVLEKLIEEKEEEYSKQELYEEYSEHRAEEAEETEQWEENAERAKALQEELEDMIDYFE